MNDANRESETLDQNRLSQWYQQFGPAIRGYLLAMSRRHDVADDLLQDVFRRAWEARQRYRELGTPRAYLLRIADRLLCDRGRRLGRETNLDEIAWCEQAATDAIQPDAAIELSEDRQRLNQALQELTPLQQRVLLLRYYGDLSFAEIAKTIECPLNTALSHARRGLAALRQRMAEVE